MTLLQVLSVLVMASLTIYFFLSTDGLGNYNNALDLTLLTMGAYVIVTLLSPGTCRFVMSLFEKSV